MLFRRGRARCGAVVVRIMWAVMLLGCSAAGVETRAWGQSAVDGAISGFVMDASGAAIAGAVVRVEDVATGFESSATTGGRGEFLVAHVPAGAYNVTVEVAWFERLELSHVVVELGEVTEVEPRLRVGSVLSSVTVTAAPEGPAAVSVEEISASAVGSTVTESELDRLPLNGRRWQDFALLTPTANLDPAGEGSLSFRGLATTQNSSRIDGADNDQSFGSVPVGSGSESNHEDKAEGGSSRRDLVEGGGGYGRQMGAAYTFSEEAIREFRVSGQNYSAVYGHAAGAIMTTVSKSGTNNVHGTAFYLVRTNTLGATNPFSIATHYVDGVITTGSVKPPDLRQQFGGSVGGAVVRDKLFYFYAYDQQERWDPAISAPDDAAFYALTPTQQALLGNRGVTQSKVNAALNYLDSLTGMVPRREDHTINFGKVDWQAAKNHRLSVQYDRARTSLPSGLRSAPVVNRGTASLGSGYVKVDAVLGRWMWTASPSVSNDLRVQYGHDFQFERAQPPLPQESAVGPGGYAPEVAIGPDGFSFGTPESLNRRAYPDEHKVMAADTVTWVRGRHEVRVGAEFSFVHDYVDELSDAEGGFHYDSGATNGHAGGLVDWITDYTFNVNAYPNGGCPSIVSPVHDFCFRSFTQSFGQEAVTFNTQEWAGFVQDDWRVRPGLTLNAGLRYEYEFLPLPQQPNGALDAVFGQTGATSIFPEDRNNFGPRVGATWEPFGTGRGLVRVGYGLFYGRLPGGTVRSALVDTALPSSATSVRILPITETDCPQVANQGFGYVCSYVSAPPAAVGATTSATVFDRRFRLPMVQQGSLTLEREVGARVVGSVTYLMNSDRQLANSVDINIAPSTQTEVFQLVGGTSRLGVQNGETFLVPVYTQRVSTKYGPVTDVVSNSDGTYNAMVLEARRRSRNGLEFRVSWTWSKALDYGQNLGAMPRMNGQFDPFSVQYDKGLSALNYPHKVVASEVWEPRVSTDQEWVRKVVNGWTVASLFSETSGRPYSYDIFGGTRLSGGHESINGAGGATYLPTVGRNTLRLPGTSTVNLRLSRRLHVGERFQMSATGEIFNVENRVNYSSAMQRAFLVGTTTGGVTPLIFQDAATVAAEGLNVRPFGVYTSAATSDAQERQVQLGLKFGF